jgi:DNA-binding beta-propeller fold protein YncE
MLILAAVAVALTTFSEPVTHATGSVVYEEVKSWAPIPSPPGTEWEMNAVATNAKGDVVYASRRFDPPILEIDPSSGKILKMWGEGMLVWPHGLYVDRDGFIWAGDATIGSPPNLKLNPRMEKAVKAGRGQQVLKFSPDGKVVMALGTKGIADAGPNRFTAPTGIAVATNGDIFVTDGHGEGTNGRVVKFSKDGKFVKTWGKPGKGPGEFDVPHCIAIDSKGRVFVGDRSNNRIQIFDQDGKFLDQWTQFGGPSGMTIGVDDTLFVAAGRKIMIGNAKDGTVVGSIENLQSEGVSVDAKGTLYASEVFNRTVRKFVRK